MAEAGAGRPRLHSAVESLRLRSTHLTGRALELGMSARQADVRLQLNGGGNGLLDTTHFDTVRFPPPDWVGEQFQAAIHDGSVAYTPYRGNEDVLSTLSGSVGDLLGVPLTPGNLALSAGTQSGLFAVLSALVDPGDLVLLADPDYLFCERILAFLGARVERVPVLYEDQQPCLDLSVVRRLLPELPRMLVFSHPNNPTGAVYSQETLDDIAEVAVEGGFVVLVDELYGRLTYGTDAFRHLVSVPGMAQRCVTLLGPSKSESMSGFRIGVVVGPADVMEAVEQSIAITSLRAPAYSQQLLHRWLVDDRDFMRSRVEDLHALRDLTVSRLREVPGLVVSPQQGTAYLFPRVSALGSSDYEVAAKLRGEAGVIVSPGYQFGPRGSGHFRVCYARDELEWSAALDRVVQCLTTLAEANGIS
jgi:aspartate/methionine/tyrosine aminotransferase